MTKILSLFLVLGGLSAHAKDNGCWQDILVVKKYPQGSNAPSECIVKEAQGPLEQLCGPSLNKKTEMFSKYMEHFNEWAAGFEKLQNTTDESQRRIINSELQSIELNWGPFGYKFEVDVELYGIAAAIDKCNVQ